MSAQDDTAVQAIGPYRVLSVLGRGAMGAVYRARHVQGGRLVALKTVEIHTEALVPTIRREVHALARLRHPGIVRILDSGSDRGVPWYAMELIKGATLRQYWTSLGPAAGPRRLGVFHGLCQALAYLHGEGLVHRDLKPDNVLVRADGTPVLVDFGVASDFGGKASRESLALEGTSAGTPLYMAPEQIRGESLDARVDLYALGCMIYELLTGQPPFTGSAWEVRQGHLERAPEPPSRLARDASPEMDELVLRLLAKDPRRRIGYAADVAAALEAMGSPPEARVAAPEAHAYLYRPGFAGRRCALEALGEALARLEARVGGIALVGGESGVGKTRLAMELCRDARRRRVRVLTGECVPPATVADADGGPLHAFAKPLQAIADRCRERGELEAQRVFGRWGRVLAAYEPSIAGLQGLEAGVEPAELAAPAARLRLYGGLTETLGAFAADRPLLVVLDDLQWADELTLGYCQFLLRTGGLLKRAVLLVGTYRTEEAGPALNEAAASRAVLHVPLDRLEEEDVGSMVADMLALEHRPQLFVRFLARHSEGNPFFVAEYLRTAVAEGVLYRAEDGRWQVSETDAAVSTEALYERLPLPCSLRELVGRHLGSLSSEARALAEAAAVLGREVDTSLLARVSGHADGGASAAAELLRRQVLEAAGAGSLRFLHDKLREVAYDRIEPARRRALHQEAAHALEASFGTGAEEHAALLGQHWERAGAALRARACYLTAARASVRQYAHQDAERFYRACIALAEGPDVELVRARQELSRDVLNLRGRHREALEELEQALQEAAAASDDAGRALCLCTLGLCHFGLGQWAETAGALESALDLQRKLGDRPGEVSSLILLASLTHGRGELAGAEALVREALGILSETRDRRAEGRALVHLGIIEGKASRYAEARAYFRQALSIQRECSDLRTEAMTLANLGTSYRRQGRLNEARGFLIEALCVHRQVGDRLNEAILLNNLGTVHQDLGLLQDARVFFEQALALNRESGSRPQEMSNLANLASVERALGLRAAARARLETVLPALRELGERTYTVLALAMLAAEAGLDADAARARELYAEALEAARVCGDRRLEAHVLCEVAALERCAGAIGPAGDLAAQAEMQLRGLDDRLGLVKALCELGHVRLARSEPAGPLLEEARSLASDAQVGPESETARAVSRLVRAVAAAEAGLALVHGEALEAARPSRRKSGGPRPAAPSSAPPPPPMAPSIGTGP
jgi:eukaryotic-like serine/threonine-protein kinase